jgi:hypothetical protein
VNRVTVVQVWAFSLLVCSQLVIAAPLPASERGDTEKLRLDVVLTDGSRIIGQPTITRVPFECALGVIDVQWTLLSSMRRDPQLKTFTVFFRNGDKLQGTPKLRSLNMSCAFGRVMVPISQVESLALHAGTSDTGDYLLHYDFNKDEGEVVRDQTADHLPATIHGARWVSNGVQGGAMSFSGPVDCLEVNVGNSFDFGTRDFAWGLWFKANRLGMTQQLIDHDYNPEIQIEPDGRLTVFVAFRFCGRMHSSKLIVPGVWYFVAFTRQGGVAQLYVNGREDASADATNCDASSQSPLTIGNNRDRVEPFAGLIDEVTIWNRSLSPSEILALYEKFHPRLRPEKLPQLAPHGQF